MSSALIVVDLQLDFCEGGPLAAAGANELATRIARFLEEQSDAFDLVVAVRDDHIDPGDHFETPTIPADFAGRWPVHGVHGTPGAELHPSIAVFPFDELFGKGAYAASTNGFEGVNADGDSMGDVFRRAGVIDVFVTGLVYEVCNADTALGAVAEGFRSTLIHDLCVPLDPAAIPTIDAKLTDAGVEVSSADDIVAGLRESHDHRRLRN